MNRKHPIVPLALAAALALAFAPAAGAQDEDAGPEAGAGAGAEAEAEVSFLNDVAPILVENCVGCHNPRKAESRYDLTSFASLARGGAMGEGIMLEPGDPDLSYFVELIRPDGVPRMPGDADPLPEAKRMVIERWVAEGAEYDGDDPEADWVALVSRAREVAIPDAYPYAMPITALAFAPDGEHVVVSGYHELNTFAIADGSLVRRSRGLAERIYDVAFSPDGSRLATAAGDPGQAGEATLWTVLEDGSIADPRRLVEIEDAVYCVAFSPDGSRLAVGGADRTIRVFDVGSGDRLAAVEDHADWVLGVAFSPDGSRLATASRDKTSKLFDAETFESLVTFPGHGEPVYCVAFSGDGDSVITGGGDSRVRIWNPGDEARQVREIRGFGGPVFDLALFADGKRLAACASDAAVRIYDAAARDGGGGGGRGGGGRGGPPRDSGGGELAVLRGHDDWIYRLAVSPDGASLATGCWDGEVKIWDAEDNSLKATILAVPGHAPDASSRADAR